MITYRQARKRIRTAARAEAVRECVRAELAKLSEAERLMCRRQERVEYDDAEIDGVLYAQKRRPRGWRPDRMTPARRVSRACALRGPCPCADCRDRARDPMAEIQPRRPGRLSVAEAEQRRIHDAEINRELALWYRLLWAPEAAAEAASHRPDDRPLELGCWSRLRIALEAIGVVSRFAGAVPPCGSVAAWLEAACPSHGPPALAAARRSLPRIAAHCMGAPVIGP